jgi:hypothetical protein
MARTGIRRTPTQRTRKLILAGDRGVAEYYAQLEASDANPKRQSLIKSLQPAVHGDLHEERSFSSRPVGSCKAAKQAKS